MLALLSPRGRSEGLDELQQLQLNQLSRLLGGRQLSRDDVALQLLGDSVTVQLNPVVVERLCYELEKRGLCFVVRPVLWLHDIRGVVAVCA